MLKLSIVVLLITGCSAVKTQKSEQGKVKKVSNKECFDSNRIKVSKVMNDGVLARLCPVKKSSYESDPFYMCEYDGDKVYLPVKVSDNDFVDDQKFTLPKDKCFIPDGVFTYKHSPMKSLLDSPYGAILQKALKERGVSEKELLKNEEEKRIRKIKITNSQYVFAERD